MKLAVRIWADCSSIASVDSPRTGRYLTAEKRSDASLAFVRPVRGSRARSRASSNADETG